MLIGAAAPVGGDPQGLPLGLELERNPFVGEHADLETRTPATVQLYRQQHPVSGEALHPSRRRSLERGQLLRRNDALG